VRINKQCPDIAGVVHVGKEDLDAGAKDQGIMFGYASDETEDCMPLTSGAPVQLLGMGVLLGTPMRVLLSMGLVVASIGLCTELATSAVPADRLSSQANVLVSRRKQYSAPRVCFLDVYRIFLS